ncbi:type VI secretion system tip protein VgrG [Candidatus Methylospira mobilis]|uniref:Type VI secretion system tip protein VgrG n=1 Tax=Candidatus Methylospira mobilis TaxID=1808979 RepID=A0A5Q0BHD7_9GAMM|nr:type VI secretion system tip protein TssI/VgrG [Candidatus Methylospira mobilis]QFY41574.1 type VI secretion system tip protein VgrG [Candidatus Methylospira mobilis]
MSPSNEKRYFDFTAVNYESKNGVKAFEVVGFSGEEAISTLYRFELLLVSKNDDIKVKEVVGLGATFVLSDGVSGKKPVSYIGLVQEFEQLEQIAGGTFYKAVLVPKLWTLETFYRSEVYLQKTRKQIFETLMNKSDEIGSDGGIGPGLTTNDYAVDLRTSAPGEGDSKLPFICQYKETNLDFITRWAQRLGIYWWYETTDTPKMSEKVVFSDVHTRNQYLGWSLTYQPENISQPTDANYLTSLILKTRPLPKILRIEGYNYESAINIATKNPSPTYVEKQIDAQGIGDIYHYIGHVGSEKEAEAIADLRAQAIRCKERQYRGNSLATGLRCGYKVKVKGHKKLEGDYLLTHVKHCGSQPIAWISGLAGSRLYELAEMALPQSAITTKDFFYQAEFTAIPHEVQFRSEMNHPWPKIAGTMKAFIDGSTYTDDQTKNGEYAELNKDGKYKVKIPYTLKNYDPLLGSDWIRRASIYAGEAYGIYFPLHKGVQVLLTFIDGNPDSPVILQAVPNAYQNALVTKHNQNQAMIKTAGNNFIGMEDTKDKQGLLIHSPTAKTMIRFGEKNALSYKDWAGTNEKEEKLPRPLPETKVSDANGLFAYTEDNIALDADKKINVKAGDTISIKAKNKISIESETGDVSITATGKVKTTSKSDTVEFCGGSWSTTTTGFSFKFSMAQTNSISLAMTNSVTAGIATSVFAGGRVDIWGLYKQEIGLGWKKELMAGAKSEYVVGSKGENIVGNKNEVVTGVKSSTVGVKVDKCVTAKDEVLGVRMEKVKSELTQVETRHSKFKLALDSGDITKETYNAQVTILKALKQEMKTLMSDIKSEVKKASVSVESGNKIFK